MYFKKSRLFVKYRFKDTMDCVFFRTFRTDRDARLWYERNKMGFALKEYGRMGVIYKG